MKELPAAYRRFAAAHPAVMAAYERLGAAALSEGPLDRRTAELVKLGIAVGARLEGAVHAHVRRALAAGATPDDVRHAVRLAITTIGFPGMMAAATWVEDVLAGRRHQRTPGRAAVAARARSRAR